MGVLYNEVRSTLFPPSFPLSLLFPCQFFPGSIGTLGNVAQSCRAGEDDRSLEMSLFFFFFSPLPPFPFLSRCLTISSSSSRIHEGLRHQRRPDGYRQDAGDDGAQPLFPLSLPLLSPSVFVSTRRTPNRRHRDMSHVKWERGRPVAGFFPSPLSFLPTASVSPSRLPARRARAGGSTSPGATIVETMETGSCSSPFPPFSFLFLLFFLLHVAAHRYPAAPATTRAYATIGRGGRDTV